jgi:hypothetical protein
VQMIATMAMNMPDLDDACRTTLIVVPAALLQQVGFIQLRFSNENRLIRLRSGKMR